LYLYGRASPINFVDPNGMEDVDLKKATSEGIWGSLATGFSGGLYPVYDIVASAAGSDTPQTLKEKGGGVVRAKAASAVEGIKSLGAAFEADPVKTSIDALVAAYAAPQLGLLSVGKGGYTLAEESLIAPLDPSQDKSFLDALAAAPVNLGILSLDIVTSGEVAGVSGFTGKAPRAAAAAAEAAGAAAPGWQRVSEFLTTLGSSGIGSLGGGDFGAAAKKLFASQKATTAETAASATYVYRLVDELGDAVYHGVTDDPVRRLGEHARNPSGPFQGMQVLAQNLGLSEAKLLETSLNQQAKAEGRTLWNAAEVSLKQLVDPTAIPKTEQPMRTLLNPKIYGGKGGR
jgi:predicted GIY-YIG superfamily endonuclease